MGSGGGRVNLGTPDLPFWVGFSHGDLADDSLSYRLYRLVIQSRPVRALMALLLSSQVISNRIESLAYQLSELSRSRSSTRDLHHHALLLSLAAPM